MNLKERTLAYIQEAENNLQCAKAILEQGENQDELFKAMKQVEFAKDTLNDVRAILRNEL